MNSNVMLYPEVLRFAGTYWSPPARTLIDIQTDDHGVCDITVKICELNESALEMLRKQSLPVSFELWLTVTGDENYSHLRHAFPFVAWTVGPEPPIAHPIATGIVCTPTHLPNDPPPMGWDLLGHPHGGFRYTNDCPPRPTCAVKDYL